MISKAYAPAKFIPYLTRDGHANRWPSDPTFGKEFAIYLCKNAHNISEKTSRMLCEFLTLSTVEVAQKIIELLLSRRGTAGKFQIHKSFWEWVLKYHDVVFAHEKAMGDRVIKRIRERHPHLLDSPISRWVNSDNESHRINGPAEIYWDHKAWFRDGKLHREDGPAAEWTDGHKEWYRNGKLHREDGPAVEYVDGEREWQIDGRLHREDGPAVIQDDGEERWFLNGKEYTKVEFDKEVRTHKAAGTTRVLGNKTLFDAPTKPLTGKTYAITGTLPINRAEAIEVIQNAGGKYSQSLNRDVILIEGKPTSGTTVKQRTAKRYKSKTIKWDDLIREMTPPPVALEPEKSTHPTFQSVMDWLLSDKDNIHKTLEAIELVDVKANCEQF